MANPQIVMLVIQSSRPRFRNDSDKVAFVVHATFVASGYKLVAIGRPALAKDALASSPTQCEVGIEGWNESDEYAFVYVDPKKGSRKVLVKCLAIDGGKLLVDAVADGVTEPAHLKIRVKEYVAESRVESDYDAQFKNLDELVTKLQNHILDKLDGGLGPLAYTTWTSSKREKEPEPEPLYYPRGPFPLGPPFHRPSGVVVVDRPDYSGLIPGPPAGTFPVVRDGFGDGNMLVGPHDLGMLHRVRDQIQLGFMGYSQPTVPPHGALYDPIGPIFETGRSGRQSPRSSRGDIHPDLQHCPRGFGSDYM
ncbi:probable proteasome inhibitor [Raphanus sativus]|uniref:Probable proteasome inhibitor n=1 Tax=Raphanus sativus TaxID=3726 RepID=A0A6J0N3K9_RAPSA|nr:probable proteasome inhibitor [Raphanus sativus]XP_018478549.1 probable proteasome inhibitor [Raphanus sativus]